jgi:hypothetical protein
VLLHRLDDLRAELVDVRVAAQVDHVALPL